MSSGLIILGVLLGILLFMLVLGAIILGMFGLIGRLANRQAGQHWTRDHDVQLTATTLTVSHRPGLSTRLLSLTPGTTTLALRDVLRVGLFPLNAGPQLLYEHWLVRVEDRAGASAVLGMVRRSRLPLPAALGSPFTTAPLDLREIVRDLLAVLPASVDVEARLRTVTATGTLPSA